jgi:glucose-1-phosphate adenylyltransferase
MSCAAPAVAVDNASPGSVPRTALADRLTQRTLALVLAGGRGTRLGPLTDHEAKPAVPFGSRFRIIDFTLANCVNSNLRRIAVLTQYRAQSLISHVQRNWLLQHRFGEFVEIVPAQQRVDGRWYAGTADAVFQNLDLIERQDPDFVLVLGGDHVYKMDYGKLLADHVAAAAAVTVACIEVPLEQASSFGVVEVDEAHRVVGWHEKPQTPRPLPGSSHRALASMGIYVFDKATLVRALAADALKRESTHDFGFDVIPALVRGGLAVHAHSFGDSCVRASHQEPYWRDVGTLDTYWQANIELTSTTSGCDVFGRSWPIATAGDGGIPSRFDSDEQGRHSVLSQCLIGSGCAIGAATIERSVVFSDIRIGHGARIDESLLLPGVQIGADVALRRVIVGQDCRLPPGLAVGFDAEQDRRRFHVTPLGITLITREMLAPPLHPLDAPDRRQTARPAAQPGTEILVERRRQCLPTVCSVAAACNLRTELTYGER